MLPSEVQRETELHVFGDVAPDFKIGETEVKVRGIMHNVDELVAMYHSGDVFAFPSKTETQGMVKIEAMLCGLPVVAFDRTACPESIDHGVNGWVAGVNDIKGFADGLVHFFSEWKSGSLDARRQSIHDSILAKYSNERILATALKVYGEVVRSC
jgi:glycosyltransferase involved in cell wall biosynthesis